MNESDTPCILCAECEHNCCGKLEDKIKKLEDDMIEARGVAITFKIYGANCLGERFEEEREEAWSRLLKLLPLPKIEEKRNK